MNEIVSIDKELCTGCGLCIQECPQQILYINRKTMTCDVTDQSLCDKQGGCEEACPVGAIKINRDI
jgi:NAD-dependent dihydropyrimidine dehydrogenase PreA subunit